MGQKNDFRTPEFAMCTFTSDWLALLALVEPKNRQCLAFRFKFATILGGRYQPGVILWPGGKQEMQTLR